MEAGLGQHLRRLREARKVSARQLALKAGIRSATLSDWETGKRQPRIPELEAVLTALDVTPTEGRHALEMIRAPRAVRQLEAQSARICTTATFGPMPAGGDLLRAMRHRCHLYLEQTADALHISAGTLSRWEQGKVMPPPDRLDALLTLLDATPQERAVLTDSVLFVLPPLQESAASVPALEAVSRPFLWPNFFVESTRLLHHKDLVYLSLAAQAWKLARDPHARRLLAEIYANYANYLASQFRFVEAERAAYAALDLRPASSTPENFYMRAALIAARASVYRGVHPVPKRGLEMLHLWRPLASWPEYKAWLLSDIGKYHALQQSLDSAIGVTEQSCEVARRGASMQEFFMRKIDLAKLLLQADRAGEALSLTLITDWKDEPFHRAEMELVRVETLLKLGDRREAANWLQRAYDEMECYHLALTPLRSTADSLARQF